MSVTLAPLITAVTAVAGATSAAVAVPYSGQSEDTKNVDVFVNVTAAVGGTAPTVVAEVQWSTDGSTFYSKDGTKDITDGTLAAAAEVLECEIKAPYFRVVTTYTGAPTNMSYTVAYRYTS
jgi:exo-beta-1,3-glucanase (GH17 family)